MSSPVYENPSADKFGPPPLPGDSRSHGRLRRRLGRLAFALAVYFLAHWLHTGSRGAWLAGFSAVVVFAASVFDYILQLHGDDEEKDPYSPPTHLTR
ncbi:MAG TPA: hypothetical protein VFT39_22335 [Vicinamibacterales bacterium]|nr:hypothetical protein [Vicinamibacterales bacterium]